MNAPNKHPYVFFIHNSMSITTNLKPANNNKNKYKFNRKKIILQIHNINNINYLNIEHSLVNVDGVVLC